MTVAKAFEISYNLFQQGVQHKLFKQNGNWFVTIKGDLK